MRCWSVLFLGGAIVLSTIGPCRAESAVGVVELSTSVQWSRVSAEGKTASLTNFTVGLGRFVTERVQLGVFFSGTEATGQESVAGAGGALAFYFPGSRPVVPYVGIRSGLVLRPYDNSLIYGVFGGLKQFMGGRLFSGGALSLEPYVWREQVNNVSRTEYGIQVGISIFLHPRADRHGESSAEDAP